MRRRRARFSCSEAGGGARGLDGGPVAVLVRLRWAGAVAEVVLCSRRRSRVRAYSTFWKVG